MPSLSRSLPLVLAAAAFFVASTSISHAFSSREKPARVATMEAGSAVLKTVKGPLLHLDSAPPTNLVKREKAVLATPIDLNKATESELEALPGIGPKKAQAIVTWRKRHGRFRRIVDLRRVKGFGPKTVRKLRQYLALSTPSRPSS